MAQGELKGARECLKIADKSVSALTAELSKTAEQLGELTVKHGVLEKDVESKVGEQLEKEKVVWDDKHAAMVQALIDSHESHLMEESLKLQETLDKAEGELSALRLKTKKSESGLDEARCSLTATVDEMSLLEKECKRKESALVEMIERLNYYSEETAKAKAELSVKGGELAEMRGRWEAGEEEVANMAAYASTLQASIPSEEEKGDYHMLKEELSLQKAVNVQVMAQKDQLVDMTRGILEVVMPFLAAPTPVQPHRTETLRAIDSMPMPPSPQSVRLHNAWLKGERSQNDSESIQHISDILQAAKANHEELPTSGTMEEHNAFMQRLWVSLADSAHDTTGGETAGGMQDAWQDVRPVIEQVVGLVEQTLRGIHPGQ